MRDITCISCKKTIAYLVYAEQLRAPTFAGIHCPHCGADQKTKFTKIVGTGNRIKTVYKNPNPKIHDRKKDYVSCSYCYTYRVGDTHEVCPFCHNEPKIHPTVEHKVVPAANVVSPYVWNMLLLDEKRAEVFKLEEEMGLVYDKQLPALIEKGVGISSIYKIVSRLLSFYQNQIKFNMYVISKLQKKIKI